MLTGGLALRDSVQREGSKSLASRPTFRVDDTYYYIGFPRHLVS